MKRIDRAIVDRAAWLVPADTRRDWLREWHAELEWSRRDGVTLAARTLRAAGAWPHAAWLRADRWRWEMLWHDVVYAARTLVRRPAFACLAVLSLAVGIGANTAMFGVVHAVLLRPLPYPDPAALVAIWTTSEGRPGRGYESTAPDFVDWRRETAGFAEMAAFVANSSALTGEGAAEQIPGAAVTGGFFDVLQVAPLHGRAMSAADDAIGAPAVAVLSHRLWRRRFGGDVTVIGRTVAIDGAPHQVIGVMPEGFAYPLSAELWVPQRFSDETLRTQRGAHYLEVIARLAGGVSLHQAEAALRGTAAALAERHPRTNAGRSVAVEPLRDSMVGEVRTALLLLLGAVGFVLLIVCVNVANLSLTRALGRGRELAVRTALGAGRARLVRGLLVESLLVALAGGALGVLLAAWATGAIAALDGPTGIAMLQSTRVDGPVLAFAIGLSLVAALLFGALPAWQASSRADVALGLRGDNGTSTAPRHRRRLGALLIVGETALAVVLLVGAGLLLRSFAALAAVDLGFQSAGVQTFSLSLPESRYPTPASRAALVATLLERIETAVPQAQSAGAVFGLPLTNFRYVISMSTLDGRTLDDQEQNELSVQVRVATAHYFQAMGIPIRRGRAFGDRDRRGAPLVAVVNEAAAARLWPGADPLGHTFTLGTRLGQGDERVGGTVIGVAGNVRDFGPATDVRPVIYVAHAQFPVDFLSVVVKTTGEPTAVVAALGQTLADLDPMLPMFRVRTMAQLSEDAVAQPRLFLTLLGLFAAAAILLAAIGIYGVLAQGVSQRTREIGLRLALGAERGVVLRMVVGQAMRLAAAGLSVGLALALGLGRLLSSLLFGVEPEDALTYLAVAAGLAGVALLASIVPARRAARVDPLVALRSE